VPDEQPGPSRRRHRERRRGRSSGSARGRPGASPEPGAVRPAAGGAAPAGASAPGVEEPAAAVGADEPAPVPAGDLDLAEYESAVGDPATDAGSAGQAERRPGTGGAPKQRRVEGDRGLRGLVGAGPSQVGVHGAMRARDAARPRAEDLAAAERDLLIVRRHYVPPDARDTP